MDICGDKGYEAFGFAGWDVHTFVYGIPDDSEQMLAWEEKRKGQGLESGSAHTVMLLYRSPKSLRILDLNLDFQVFMVTYL